MRCGQKGLGPVFDPLQRDPELLRQTCDDIVLGIGLELRAEPATDLRGDRAHLVFAHVIHASDEASQQVGGLRR